MAIEIKKVTGNSDLKKFIRFNYDLYKDNKNAVPELYTDMVDTLSKDRNPAFEFCESDYFIAYKDGKIAGRIAAIINHKANKKWNLKSVRFGFIDFIEDFEVAAKLIETVEKWGHERGMNEIVGPLGFTDFDYEGMLTEGFDQLGTMASIYNYPYYPEYFKKMGFVDDAEWVEFKIFVPDAIPEKHQRITEIVRKKFNLQVKKYKSGKKIAKDYGQAIFQLLNESYKDLYGFSELSPKQIDLYIKTYLPVVDLDMVTLITEEDGTLIGVGISMPSMSRALQKAKGRLFPFGWYHLLKALFFTKPKVIDLLLVAIKPEYQGKGVNALLFSDLIPIYQKKGVVYAESNPELVMNNKVQSQWSYFDCQQHKRRKTFKREIKIK